MTQSFIPYGRQDITSEDIDAVTQVLKSDWLTQGPFIEAFENALCSYTNAKYAIAVCNATAALHLACLALGVQKGDIVWTSPNTFLASANCAIYCGADVDFIDICPKTYNISVEALEKKLLSASQQGKLPKVVIAVHFAGQSCQMKPIKKLADQYGFKLIEDAAHAIGGRYLDQPIGSCLYSDITVFSFHPVKIITTGEGGVLITNQAVLAEKIRLLRTHGMSRDSATLNNTKEGEWYYEQVELGYNYRITDLQCALGLSQLKRLDHYVEERQKWAHQYNILLKNLPVSLPYQSPETYSAFHLYVIRLQLDKIKKTRKEIFSLLRDAKIGVNVHYIPVHTQPYYKNRGFNWGDFPVSEQYYKEAITLPLWPHIGNHNVNYICETLNQILSS